MEELMGQSSTYLIALVGAVAVALTEGGKAVIKALSDSLVSRIRRRRIDNNTHELYNAVENHLRKSQYKDFSSSGFKNQVIKDCDSIFWNTLRDSLKTLDTKKPEEEFKEDLLTILGYVTNMEAIYTENGLPEKVANVIAASSYLVSGFLTAISKRLVSTDIYESNAEKLWVVQSLFLEYINVSHEATINAMIMANGSLKGIEYKGFTAE